MFNAFISIYSWNTIVIPTTIINIYSYELFEYSKCLHSLIIIIPTHMLHSFTVVSEGLKPPEFDSGTTGIQLTGTITKGLTTLMVVSYIMKLTYINMA